METQYRPATTRTADGVALLLACRDAFEVAILAIRVNRARSRRGPQELAQSLRLRGAQSRPRSARERASLRRLIRFVDSLFPSGPNCYRRALIEIATDAGAAKEPLRMGLVAEGGLNSGHAWLASSPDPDRRYDAEFSV
jgi:hypothetical protein